MCLLGCKTVPAYMHEVASPAPFAPEPGKALVVFVRPSGVAFRMAAKIMDDGGAFLGSAVAGGCFAVTRAAGKQSFVVWSTGTDVLWADLAPDRIYFVEVNPVLRALQPNFHFKTSHRGTDIFPYKAAYLEGTRRYQVDAAQAEQETRDEAAERKERLGQTAGADRDLSPEERVEHTLTPEDGHRALGVVDAAP